MVTNFANSSNTTTTRIDTLSVDASFFCRTIAVASATSQFVALLAWISGKAFKTTADGVVANGLARGKTSADSSLTYWNTLGGRAVTITIVRAIVIGLTFSDNHGYALDGRNSSESRSASTDRVVVDHLALGVWHTRLVGAGVDATLIGDVTGLGVQAVIVADAACFGWNDHLWRSRANGRRSFRRKRS